MPPADYLRLLKTEIETRSARTNFQDKDRPKARILNTLYFGGGTPSLLKPQEIAQIIAWIKDAGFQFAPDCEITIEINPATVDGPQMEELLKIGVNRFSVGLQTLKDEHLKFVKRKHSAQDTCNTIELIQSYGVNYSLDLLFALPHQTLEELEKDLDQLVKIRPPHISPYCLTVNESHVLAKLRPMDEIQLKMFERIHDRLTAAGYERYEISNYALPGKHSRHNSLYWEDQEYWGIGLSAHSYDPRAGDWGTRFWNPRSIKDYEKQIGQPLPDSQVERLTPWESLTDYCHTSLRRAKGLSIMEFQEKFGAKALKIIQGPLDQLKADGLVIQEPLQSWRLTDQGITLSNQVFQALTCLEEEWRSSL